MANIKRSGLWAALVTLLLLGGCKGEEDNMLFQAENYCLFSAMEGTLTFQGKPAAGAKVVRKITVDDKEDAPDFVMADENGKFSLATINRKIREPLMVAAFVIDQDIFVHYQGSEYHIWAMSNVGKTSEHEEFGGRKPINVRCEITDEMVRVEIETGLLGTSCVWDSFDEGGVK